VSFDPIEHVERTFADNAGRVFLIEHPLGRQLTFGEFRGCALRAAALLRSLGVSRGDRVALLLANSPEFAALYFACMFVGAVAVPINQALHPREVAQILGLCGARHLLFSNCTRSLVMSAASGIPLRKVRVVLGQEKAFHPEDGEECWSFETPATDAKIVPFEGVSSTDPFVLLYTSGTTGVPKGVLHRLSSEVSNAHAFNQLQGFSHASRFLHVWPMAYSTGLLNTLLSPFCAGASVVIAPAFGPQTILTFWKPVVQYRVDTLWLSPTMLASLLRVDRDAAGLEYCRANVKTVCVGTAPLPLKLRKDFEARYGVELFESYGLSELLIITANSASSPRKDNSVGRLLPDVELRTLDDSGATLGQGQDGELFVRTPYAMVGYLDEHTQQPVPLSREAFFATGDIGHVDADGDVFITGRKKDLIIRGGQNISPRAVRDVLLEHPAVEDAQVLGLPHDFYGEEVAAAVVMKPGFSVVEHRPALLEHCRKRLSPGAVPTRLVGFKELPLGSTGKVLVRALKDTLLGLPATAVEA
jgi:long-chain acyl-CoA synthetase